MTLQHSGVFMIVVLWSGCAPEVSRYLVVDGREGQYSLTEVSIPELVDPVRMRGTLGDGRVGGYLFAEGGIEDLEHLEYRGGGPLTLRYSADGEVAIPHTDDGIVLWSYYHTLSSVRAELEALDIEVSPIFPVDFAYQPNVGGSLFTTTNAAYAGSGVHLFALLADTRKSPLPLAANPGVIRHELGHALFQLIVAGSVDTLQPANASPEMRALNEGFADILATLTLDDPNFLAISLPVLEEARRVDSDASIADAESVNDDPYSRGTVYASLAWDLRVLTDANTALQLSVTALQRWASAEPWMKEEEEEELGLPDIDAWAQQLVSAAVEHDSALLEEMCAAHLSRFGTRPLEACP